MIWDRHLYRVHMFGIGEVYSIKILLWYEQYKTHKASGSV